MPEVLLAVRQRMAVIYIVFYVGIVLLARRGPEAEAVVLDECPSLPAIMML